MVRDKMACLAPLFCGKIMHVLRPTLHAQKWSIRVSTCGLAKGQSAGRTFTTPLIANRGIQCDGFEHGTTYSLREALNLLTNSIFCEKDMHKVITQFELYSSEMTFLVKKIRPSKCFLSMAKDNHATVLVLIPPRPNPLHVHQKHSPCESP